MSFSITLATVIQVVSRLGDDSTLREAVARLDQRELLVLLQFSSKWNTNSRTANVRLDKVLRQSLLIKGKNEGLMDTYLKNNYLPYFGELNDRSCERLCKLL